MPEIIAARLAKLQTRPRAQQRQESRTVIGGEPSSYYRRFLFNRVAWAIQAKDYGGLSARAQARQARWRHEWRVVPALLPYLWEYKWRVSFALVLLVAAALLDVFSAILVVLPLILPLAAQYDVNPIHLGILFLINLEIALLVRQADPERRVVMRLTDPHLAKTLREAAEVHEEPGTGLTGTIHGSRVHVTSRQKLLAAQPELAPQLPERAAGMECVVLLDDRRDQPALGTEESLLILDEVQPAGKKSMSGKSFLAGARHWA